MKFRPIRSTSYSVRFILYSFMYLVPPGTSRISCLIHVLTSPFDHSIHTLSKSFIDQKTVAKLWEPCIPRFSNQYIHRELSCLARLASMFHRLKHISMLGAARCMGRYPLAFRRSGPPMYLASVPVYDSIIILDRYNEARTSQWERPSGSLLY